MKKLRNTLFVLSEDAYLTLDVTLHAEGVD